VLYELLPAFSNLSDIIHVIAVPEVTNGKVLRVLMNADIDRAVGMLSPFTSSVFSDEEIQDYMDERKGIHWRWRTEMAERMAAQLDAQKFGVKSIYLAGSTQNTTAQAGSDIDILVNFTGNPEQQRDLKNWLDGWSLSLDELNFLRTGYKAGGILDIHYVSDQDLTDMKELSEKLQLPIDGITQLPLGKNKK
jgi:hypothetical protein